MYRNIIFDLDETLVMSYKATELLFEFIVSNNDIPVSGNDFRMVFRRHKLEFMDKFKRFEFYNYGIGTYDLFLNENIFNYVPQQYSDFQYGILETTFDELKLSGSIRNQSVPNQSETNRCQAPKFLSYSLDLGLPVLRIITRT